MSRNKWKEELKAKENAPPPVVKELNAEELRQYLIEQMSKLPAHEVALFARQILACAKNPKIEIEDIQRRGKGIELRYRVTESFA